MSKEPWRPTCANPSCPDPNGRIVRHSSFRTRKGLRQRYRCGTCKKTFSAGTGSPYHRLRSTAITFDRAISMSVEGVSKAGIARVLGLSWGTVARWIRRGALHATAFNDRHLRQVEAVELQADELKGYTVSKEELVWVQTALEISSRLWLTSRVGRRTRRDTRLHFADLNHRCASSSSRTLLTTDFFKYNEDCVLRTFGPRCLYAQVDKTYRGNRVIKVDRKFVIGSRDRVEEALLESEDSRKLNTAFIERLNLTIRRSLAALQRKTTAAMRSHRSIAELIELLKCSYNFTRPHQSLRFGKVTRTPAMQAGIATRRLTWREIFLSLRPYGPPSATTHRPGSAFQGLDVPPTKSRRPKNLAWSSNS
jgi:transposase-like protein